MEDRIERARYAHANGYNCAQSVLCAYADLLGEEEQTLFRISEGFGAGMGDMSGTCGAVTAMFMAAGLKTSCANLSAGNTKPQTMRQVLALADAFRKKNGSLICRELKGIDSGEPLRSCDGCIEDAVRILGETIFAPEEKTV